MFAKVDAALRDVMYLMGEYIVFATVDISSIEVAAGVRDIMMQSGGWGRMLQPRIDLRPVLDAYAVGRIASATSRPSGSSLS